MKTDGAHESEGRSDGAGAPEAGATGAGAPAAAPGRNARFRTTLLRVLLVQVAALALLWLLQSTFHG